MTPQEQVPPSSTSSSSSTVPTTTASAPTSINPLAANPVYPPDSSSSSTIHHASGRQPATAASASPELSSAKIRLRQALRHFADFPIKGIDFVDIMPLFMDPTVHATLVDALQLQISEAYDRKTPDVVVGLDARGFLFGPGLALRLGVGFAPVRKKGKLPGPCVTATYQKEYGADLFQMQEDAIKPGQRVLIVDDIIATGEFMVQPRRPLPLTTTQHLPKKICSLAATSHTSTPCGIPPTHVETKH
jgi:adenine phosphoribosyltransferase